MLVSGMDTALTIKKSAPNCTLNECAVIFHILIPPNTRQFIKGLIQKDHSIHSMEVSILEKIYLPTKSLVLSKRYRREGEEYMIRRLGTAVSYDCNENIKSIDNY